MSDDRSGKKSVAPFTFIKGFASGVLFVTVINKFTFIGAALGIASGIYYEQTNPKGCPDIAQISNETQDRLIKTWQDLTRDEEE